MKNKGKMNRRKFLKLSAAGAATASAAALMLNSGKLFNTTNTLENNSQTIPQDAKKVFSKCGACSHTFFYLLNREFGYAKKTHYYELSEQTNISKKDAVKVFSTKWKGPTDFDKIVSEYKENIFNIDNRHYDRYRTKDYAFVVAGAEIIKK